MRPGKPGPLGRQPAHQVCWNLRLSQRRVAETAACSQTFIWLVFNGWKRPTSRVIDAVERLTGRPARELFTTKALGGQEVTA